MEQKESLYPYIKCFQKHQIYTLYADEKIVEERLKDADIYTSFLQNLPNILRSKFRFISIFAIPIIENINLFKYDIVISSSAFFGKGVITHTNTRHIAYCHTPPRVLWGIDKIKTNIFNILPLHLLRIWDVNSSYRPTQFIANSKTTQKRIKKYYDKDSKVVYPPVSVDTEDGFSKLSKRKQNSTNKKLPNDFYLVVSNLTDHKRIDLVVQAFSRMNYPLVIIGTGRLYKRLQNNSGDTTVFLGYQPDSIVYECMKRCKAFIHTAEEDFGIAMVEAMMYGKPVLAFKNGGASEIIEEGKTGEFFNKQDTIVLADGIRRINEKIEQNAYDPEYIKQSVEKFSKDNFIKEMHKLVDEK